jgi:hypothetical protein
MYNLTATYKLAVILALQANTLLSCSTYALLNKNQSPVTQHFFNWQEVGWPFFVG